MNESINSIDNQDKSHDSIFVQARNYLIGDNCKKDNILAMDMLYQLADIGHTRSQFLLGVIYEDGEIVEQNFISAMKFYHLATEQNYLLAHVRIANLYLIGWGSGDINFQKSFEHLKIAADLGHARSMYKLGSFYQKGLYVDKNIEKALEYFVKSANAGCICSYVKILDDFKNFIYDEESILVAEYMTDNYEANLNFQSAPSRHVLNDDVKIKFTINNLEISRKNFNGIDLDDDKVLKFEKILK